MGEEYRVSGGKTNIQKKQQLEVRRTIFRQYIVELEFLHIARSKISLHIAKGKLIFANIRNGYYKSKHFIL